MPHSVGKATLLQLRRRYRETWNRDWPEPDDYLKELWLEARNDHRCRAQVPPAEVWDTCLSLMRESHEH